jgi:periplasmic protein CpxP/Spy
MLKPKMLTTAFLLSLSLGTAASIAIAQEPGKPSEHTGQPNSEMMGNRDGGMMGMMNGVDPAQMKRMVENCNRMMENMMQNTPASGPEKKG